MFRSKSEKVQITRANSRKNVRKNVRASTTVEKRKHRLSTSSGRAKMDFAFLSVLLKAKSLNVLLIGLLVLSVLFVMLRSSYLFLNVPIENVRLYADLERVTTLEVEGVLSEYKKIGFLDINLDHVREALKVLPWIDRAEVQRRWPNSLEVTLVEQVAVARWGERGLLNSRGELIMRDAKQGFLPPELPQLDGVSGSEWRVAQRYLELHNLVVKHGLYIEELNQDDRGSWSFTLSNGTTVKLGKHATDARIRRFAKQVLPNMLQQKKMAEVLDMRYSNGFTVKWRERVEPIDNTSRLEIESDA